MKIKCEIEMSYLFDNFNNAKEIIKDFDSPRHEFRQLRIFHKNGQEIYVTETEKGFEISDSRSSLVIKCLSADSIEIRSE